jgi:3-oxoacyl-[acyl-carrier-protein] synthase II
MEKRVVITGIGVVSSVGIGKEEYWANIIAGKSGIAEIQGFDTSAFSCHVGGEIPNFKCEDFLDTTMVKEMDRGSQFAVAASKLAIEDAGVDLEAVNKEKVGIMMGTTNGEAQVLQKIHDSLFIKRNGVSIEQLCRQYPAYMINANVANVFGFRGDNVMIPNACAAANFSIAYAYDLLRANRLDSVLAGGADPFSRIAFTGFSRLLAMAPERVQPFDCNRKGILVGEGAGVLYLERLENALKRDVPIYAEILGYGVSCDAHHITTPHPEAEGITIAMKRAMKSAKIDIEDVDYISPHGTGTSANDKAETIALQRVFKEKYKTIPISSIKSMLGHTMGAASAIEASTCAMILKNDIIPPTINYNDPDHECDLDCVPNEARELEVKLALNNSYAFGGNNSCLVFKKFQA